MKKERREELHSKEWFIPYDEDIPFSNWKEGDIFRRERRKSQRFQFQLIVAGVRLSILKTMLWVFVAAFVFTLGVIVMDGFHLWGFDLPTSTVNFLSVATIGEIAALIGTLLGIQVTARGIGSGPEDDEEEDKEE
jgi:hypothetical protein